MDRLTRTESARVDNVLGELIQGVELLVASPLHRISAAADELDLCGEAEAATAFRRFADAEAALEGALHLCKGVLKQVSTTKEGLRLVSDHGRWLRAAVLHLRERPTCQEVLEALPRPRRNSTGTKPLLACLYDLRAGVARRMHTTAAEEQDAHRRVASAQERIKLVEHDARMLRREIASVQKKRAADREREEGIIASLSAELELAVGAVASERADYAAERDSTMERGTEEHKEAEGSLAKLCIKVAEEVDKQRKELLATEVDARRRTEKLEGQVVDIKADFDRRMREMEDQRLEQIAAQRAEAPQLKKLSEYYALVRRRCPACAQIYGTHLAGPRRWTATSRTWRRRRRRRRNGGRRRPRNRGYDTLQRPSQALCPSAHTRPGEPG